MSLGKDHTFTWGLQHLNARIGLDLLNVNGWPSSTLMQIFKDTYAKYLIGMN